MLEVEKRGELFVGTDDESLSVAAMCVCNPDCSPFGINDSDPAQTPTGFLKITGNYFPVLHFLLE